jgi:hypothetical protein
MVGNVGDGGFGMRLSVVLITIIICCYSGLGSAASAQTTRCLYISGTADGLRKSKAIEDSLASLAEAISKLKTDNGIAGPMTQTAMKPEPHPYWRSTVSPELLLPPDTVTDTTYTLCWKGVVSPVVCTTGAQVCW